MVVVEFRAAVVSVVVVRVVVEAKVIAGVTAAVQVITVVAIDIGRAAIAVVASAA